VVNNLAAWEPDAFSPSGFTGDDGEATSCGKIFPRWAFDTSRLHLDRERRRRPYLKPRDIGRRGLEGEHSRYDTKTEIPRQRPSRPGFWLPLETSSRAWTPSS
jgi:hypothetical protein